jgi:hypothetical protein
MPSVHFSSDRNDIIDVNRRSALCKSGISIIELSMLDGLMDKKVAEEIRQEIIGKSVGVRQLTNFSEIYADWTKYSKELQEIMQIRYIPKEIFHIETEILIFDDIVAMYRVEPEISYTEISDQKYAQMMRAFFDNLWRASQAMIWWVWGSAMAKQYLPLSGRFKDIPLVIYPAKDDGNIVQAYSTEESIISYIDRILPLHEERIVWADMLILYVWNDGKTPMVDIWKVMRNTMSDDSWFLYDGFTLRGESIETSMWTASGNSLIVFTAEELLLRRLIMEEGKSFTEASDRRKYFPAFPAGLIPGERFIRN